MSILDLGDTTVDVKLYAGDIARLVGSEECNSFGDLFRIPHPAQRNCFPEPVFHLGERLPLLQIFHYGRIDSVLRLLFIVISSYLFVRDPDITALLSYVTRQHVCQDRSMSGRV